MPSLAPNDKIVAAAIKVNVNNWCRNSILLIISFLKAEYSVSISVFESLDKLFEYFSITLLWKNPNFIDLACEITNHDASKISSLANCNSPFAFPSKMLTTAWTSFSGIISSI